LHDRLFDNERRHRNGGQRRCRVGWRWRGSGRISRSAGGEFPRAQANWNLPDQISPDGLQLAVGLLRKVSYSAHFSVTAGLTRFKAIPLG
jgi:hypothetical protein